MSNPVLLYSKRLPYKQVRAMGYTGGSNDKRSSTSSGGNGKSRPRSNGGGGGGGGRRRDYDGEESSDEEGDGGDGDGALDCDESLDAAATDDEVRHRFGLLSGRHTASQTAAAMEVTLQSFADVHPHLLDSAGPCAARRQCDAWQSSEA